MVCVVQSQELHVVCMVCVVCVTCGADVCGTCGVWYGVCEVCVV